MSRIEQYMICAPSWRPLQAWRTYHQIGRFLRHRGIEINTLSVHAERQDNGVVAWWAYSHELDAEPEDSETNYIHADQRFEFYGVTT